jgi:membrane protein DedA with SNARE-associated domain
MDSVLASLANLPPAVLYSVLALVAAIENVIPPFPADVTIAFGAFLAARGDQAMAGVFIAAMLGNTVGAMAVYAAAKRYGAGRFERMVGLRHTEQREARFRELFAKYGVAALFAARFIPGVRALVPPVAGALKVPPLATAVMLLSASAVWYAGIVYLAIRVEEWAELEGQLATVAGVAALISVGTLLIGTVAWLIFRNRQPT